MDTPAHPFPGQNDIDDDGHYPEQTDDARDAIIHTERSTRQRPSRRNRWQCRRGSQPLFGRYRHTRIRHAGPCGASLRRCLESHRPNGWALDCVGGETCPHNAVANYLDIPDPAPNPPVGSDLALAQEACQLTGCTSHVSVLGHVFKQDSLGIPTSTGFNIHSYLPNNTLGVLENGENGIVPTALAIGLTESTSNERRAGSFKATIVPVSLWSHSFELLGSGEKRRDTLDHFADPSFTYTYGHPNC